MLDGFYENEVGLIMNGSFMHVVMSHLMLMVVVMSVPLFIFIFYEYFSAVDCIAKHINDANLAVALPVIASGGYAIGYCRGTGSCGSRGGGSCSSSGRGSSSGGGCG